LSHGRAGDIDAGASRAWRQLRRPSDMVRHLVNLCPLGRFAVRRSLTRQNEHAAELRRLRSKEASAGKASGTVFVKGKLPSDRLETVLMSSTWHRESDRPPSRAGYILLRHA